MPLSEFKPRKAKYGFQIQIDSDMLHPFALVYSVLADVPQHPDVWWMETPNNMGRCSINIYVNDPDLYEELRALVNVEEVPQPKLVLALPDYEKRKVVIASDELIDGERFVCIAIKEPQ